MSRTPATFKHSDVVRALKAARAAGHDVIETKIGRDGCIVMVHKAAAPVPDDADAALNAWQAKRHGSYSA